MCLVYLLIVDEYSFSFSIMSLNGKILAISLETNSELVASTLREAKNLEELEEIGLHAITFDCVVTDALIALLSHNDKRWKRLEVINCRGELDHAIRLAMSIDCLDSLHIVRNVELFGGCSVLGAGLQGTDSLKKLRLTSTIYHADAVALAEGLAACKSIEIADFRWCTFEDESLATFVSLGLSKNKSLKSVDFFGCVLDDNKIAQLLSSLIGHPTLESLMLNGNKCGELGSQEVGALIQAEACALQKFDLSFQRLDNGMILNISPLTQALKHNTSLQSLDLTGNGLNDSAALQIAEAVVHNRTLRELYLARNKFTDVGVTAIARTLPHMQGLKKLSLWGNPFGEDGARELLNGMAQNMELCDLHLFRKFKCSEQIQYFTNINRGGRKLLQGSPNGVPMALWPMVLERVNTMKLPMRRKDEENDIARIDMLYCLLRGPVLFARGLELGQ